MLEADVVATSSKALRSTNKWGHRALSKRREQNTRWGIITFQKNWCLIHAAANTLKLSEIGARLE